MATKIYTKTGDSGETALFGGSRLSKGHLRIHTYGTVDELNSCIGVVRDHLTNDISRNELQIVQSLLFNIGSHLAADPSKPNLWLPPIGLSAIEQLEKSIDDMEAQLTPLKTFILPGGHPTVSFCHVARCVCRRAERYAVTLNENEKVEEIIIKFLNRLSDYLFVLARYISKLNNAEEIAWEPR